MDETAYEVAMTPKRLGAWISTDTLTAAQAAALAKRVETWRHGAL